MNDKLCDGCSNKIKKEEMNKSVKCEFCDDVYCSEKCAIRNGASLDFDMIKKQIYMCGFVVFVMMMIKHLFFLYITRILILVIFTYRENVSIIRP